MNLAVIFGGKSTEHEVSRLSAVNVLKALEGDQYEVFVIGITKEGRWYITKAPYEAIADGSWENDPSNRQVVIPHDPVVHGILVFDQEDRAMAIRIDCVIPVLHGAHGEDGDIQGLLELAEIPYVGSGVAATANSMDKSITKVLAAQTGVRQAKHCVLRLKEYREDPEGVVMDAFTAHNGHFPLFVKPSSAGSSVGASKAKNLDQLREAVAEAFKYDKKVLVEEAIVGREIECAVIGNNDPKASRVGEILSAGEFYTYDAKYKNPESKTRVVEDLPDETINKVRQYAIAIYKALDCRGLSRVDFFYSNEGEIVFNEINSLPGFTNIIMYPMLWEDMGISQPQLLDSLIKLAMEEHSDWVRK